MSSIQSLYPTAQNANDTLDCGYRGCCPRILCKCGGPGTAVSPDSGCRGMVAVIVDWGTCTVQDTNFQYVHVRGINWELYLFLEDYHSAVYFHVLQKRGLFIAKRDSVCEECLVSVRKSFTNEFFKNSVALEYVIDLKLTSFSCSQHWTSGCLTNLWCTLYWRRFVPFS